MESMDLYTEEERKVLEELHREGRRALLGLGPDDDPSEGSAASTSRHETERRQGHDGDPAPSSAAAAPLAKFPLFRGARRKRDNSNLGFRIPRRRERRRSPGPRHGLRFRNFSSGEGAGEGRRTPRQSAALDEPSIADQSDESESELLKGDHGQEVPEHFAEEWSVFNRTALPTMLLDRRARRDVSASPAPAVENGVPRSSLSVSPPSSPTASREKGSAGDDAPRAVQLLDAEHQPRDSTPKRRLRLPGHNRGGQRRDRNVPRRSPGRTDDEDPRGYNRDELLRTVDRLRAKLEAAQARNRELVLESADREEHMVEKLSTLGDEILRLEQQQADRYRHINEVLDENFRDVGLVESRLDDLLAKHSSAGPRSLLSRVAWSLLDVLTTVFLFLLQYIVVYPYEVLGITFRAIMNDGRTLSNR